MQARVIEQGKRGEFASTAHREDCPFCTAYRCGMTFLDVVLKVPFARVAGPFFGVSELRPLSWLSIPRQYGNLILRYSSPTLLVV